MRSLVYGGTGLLGSALAAEMRRRRWPVLALSRRQADVRDDEGARRWLGTFAPEVVFNCAAFTRVDECEDRVEHAMEVNGEAVGRLARAAADHGARLVHVSSDYVFDGRTERPYREADAPAPLSVYGQSKRRGEVRALETEGSLVVRASWLFGPHGPSFVTTMTGLMDRGASPLRVVDDQVGAPTYAPFLARALADLAGLGASGIVHYRNREPVSWYGFAREIASEWAPRVEVVPVTTDEFPRPASRPAYSVLDVSRFEELAGRRVEPWIAGLAPCLRRLAEGRFPNLTTEDRCP